MTGHCHLQTAVSSSSDDTNTETGMGLAAIPGDVTALPSCQHSSSHLLQLIVPCVAPELGKPTAPALLFPQNGFAFPRVLRPPFVWSDPFFSHFSLI